MPRWAGAAYAGASVPRRTFCGFLNTRNYCSAQNNRRRLRPRPRRKRPNIFHSAKARKSPIRICLILSTSLDSVGMAKATLQLVHYLHKSGCGSPLFHFSTRFAYLRKASYKTDANNFSKCGGRVNGIWKRRSNRHSEVAQVTVPCS